MEYILKYHLEHFILSPCLEHYPERISERNLNTLWNTIFFRTHFATLFGTHFGTLFGTHCGTLCITQCGTLLEHIMERLLQNTMRNTFQNTSRTPFKTLDERFMAHFQNTFNLSSSLLYCIKLCFNFSICFKSLKKNLLCPLRIQNRSTDFFKDLKHLAWNN